MFKSNNTKTNKQNRPVAQSSTAPEWGTYNHDYIKLGIWIQCFGVQRESQYFRTYLYSYLHDMFRNMFAWHDTSIFKQVLSLLLQLFMIKALKLLGFFGGGELCHLLFDNAVKIRQQNGES